MVELVTSARIAADALANAVRQTVEWGFAHIEGMVYADEADIPSIKAIQESFFRLPGDDEGGQRFRAYVAYILDGGALSQSDTSEYAPGAGYRFAEGDKIRRFPLLEPRISASELLHRVIQIDVAVASGARLISLTSPVRVGVHQVRYQPSTSSVSYSSPPWLHKDDEPAVFIHLLNSTANLTGGDNVLSNGKYGFESIIRLEHPLDSILLTQKKYHAVTPIGVRAGPYGYRDILIVALQSEEGQPHHAPWRTQLLS